MVEWLYSLHCCNLFDCSSSANMFVICDFIQKIAIELIVESGGGTKSFFLQNACSTPATNAANICNLKLGLEEYVSKHGNKLTEACHSCFSTGLVLMIKVQFYPTIGLEIFLH